MQSSTTSSSSEVVYGERNSVAGSDESRVMSEKVQIMASSIYKEFELMIRKFGEESVKELMPLVVNVLESLDLSYLEKEEHLVDLEMLKEDNEQLMNQHEREKQLRKSQDQKCLEIEDSLMEQVRDLENKIESLESITRMLELKAKNATDHATRLEEREADQKIEFERLHERYNDLLRTHIEHVERTKYLMGADKFDMMQSLPLPKGNIRTNAMATSVDANVRGISDIISSIHMSQSTHADVNLANHISNERDWQEEFGQTDFLSPRDGLERQVSAESRSIKEEEEIEPDTHRSEKEPEDALSADLTGMGREVENLIKENTELMETKNALNIVKNDLIARVDELSSEHEILREEIRSLEMVKLKMSERIRELEAEVKSIKEKQSEEEDQEDIPMAQRKRFTRVEMARVLMERNQYKEKLMELQDAVKYTEMQRAKRMNTQGGNSKGRIWDFFSGLFGDSPQPNYNNGHRKLARKSGEDQSLRRKAVSRNFDFDNDSVQEKRMAERRQQYKAVSQHMKRDDESRTQAYGWSIPSTVDTASTSSAIPVPVCCRPLLDRQPSLKIWCAAGVTLLGGRTRDGGYIVGESVFYNDDDSHSVSEETTPIEGNTTQQIEKLNHENAFWEYSSLIWVCSSNERRSFVTIFDGNNPNNILECFNACDSHILSVASVPGVRKSDYPNDDQHTNLIRDGGYLEQIPNDIASEKEQFGAVQWIPIRRDSDAPPTYCSVDDKGSPKRERTFSVSNTPADKSLESADEIVTESVKDAPAGAQQRTVRFNIATPMGIEAALENTTPICTPLEKRDGDGGSEDPEINKAEAEKTHTGWTGLPPHIRDGLSKYEGVGEITTALPTMWMGLENDYIQIHSGVSEWRKCLRKIRMSDAVLSILHYKGRVFAALANGSIAVFHRDSDGNWADNGYHILFLGKGSSAISYLTIVSGRIWAAYRNCVVIIEPKTLMIENVFVAHPRRDSQIRHMIWIGDGVWISVRLDSTLRLYHAHNYQHLQDVDIEPYITKMLGLNRIDFPQLRITALLVLNKRLWIGTGSGVIISVPLSEENQAKIEVIKTDSKRGLNEEVRGPGGLIRVYGDPRTERVSPGSFIPYCNMTQGQLSFHGHKDAVRFFLAVPAESNSKLLEEAETRKILITSGGDGYIDLRLGEDDEQRVTDQPRIRDMSHLIVWELECPNTQNTHSH
uniref:JNK-interacting protein 3 n=1 Tax=Acrobeloides nanus TaxID=290746 RepID=A0A914D9M4_9BILA